MEGGPLILDIFDPQRAGVRHIAEQICLQLDYHSLVSLKRSCATLYTFLQSTVIEQTLLSRKLNKDWATGEPRVSTLTLASEAPVAVNHVKLVEEGAEVMLSTVRNIYNYTYIPPMDSSSESEHNSGCEDCEVADTVTNGLKLNLRLPSTSLNSKINSAFSPSESDTNFNRVFVNSNENLEKNQITQFDILESYLVAGNNNGILSIWDTNTAELICSKQLFGIITGVKCIEAGGEDLIVTSHAGKAYDIGCISVRRLVTRDTEDKAGDRVELAVVWSAYQDVMPVFCLAASPVHIITLEWLGTFDLVHVGSATLYTRTNDTEKKEKLEMERRDFTDCQAVETRRSATGLIRNLQRQSHFSTVEIFKDDYAGLCSADDPQAGFSLNIYELTTLTLLQTFPGHTCGIFQVICSGDILVTRDKQGSIIIWDAKLATDENYVDTDPHNSVLMRKLNRPHKDKILSVDMDLRRLAIGRIGGVQVLDFWSADKS